MNTINSDSVVDLFFQLKWNSPKAIHTDCFQANNVNMWRDILPPALLEGLKGRSSGESLDLIFASGKAVPGFENRDLVQIKTKQFDTRQFGSLLTEPRVGRFYPKGVLKGITGIFKANMAPFRCVEKNNGHMTVDFNHPLAENDLRVSTIVGKIETKQIERGGTSVDWIETLTDGPGMQARWRDRKSEYFSDGAFLREDTTPDSRFYQKPRMTQHMDDTALEMVRNTYGRFLQDGMRVLDLMSSWQSHVPANLRLERLAGLGLNAAELKRNALLTDKIVHDLNAEPTLPYAANTFDVVLCTASIEYLIDPFAIFNEVGRVLKPKGHFVITVSNRWFPPKAIKLWAELHEFERMGLILEYFLHADVFENLHTYSIRGLPRPHHDKYFPAFKYSDPLYAVWGRKK
jgi:SAM-dependent methyltransferase/FKBP-type peptidyl-prolyl cis-trans isomerase 2